MPESNENPRLSNLGVTDPSRAGAKMEDAFGPDKLAALLEGTIGLDRKLAQTRAEPKPSAGQNLLSTRSIAPLVLAGLSALLGGEGGQAAAAGILQGTVAGAGAKAQAQAAKRQEDIDSMQDTLDKRRNAITTILQAQPGLLTDSNGKDAVDPVVLGTAVTGVPLALSPASLIAERRRTVAQEQRIAFWSDRLTKATTPEEGVQAARQLSNVMGLDLTPEDITVLSTTDESGFWEQMVSNTGIDTGSALSAWLYSIQNGKNRFDPAVIGKLRPAIKTGGNIEMDDVVIALSQEWNDAVKDNPALAKMPPDQQVSVIFRDRPGDLAILQSKLKTTEGQPSFIDTKVMQDVLTNTNNLVNTLYLMAPDAALRIFGTKEQAAKTTADIARAQLGQLNSELAARHGSQVGSVYVEIESEYEIQHPDATPGEVHAQSLRIFNAVLKTAAGDATSPDFDVESLRGIARKAIDAGLPRASASKE